MSLLPSLVDNSDIYQFWKYGSGALAMIPRAGTAQRGVRDLREKSGKSSVTEINDDDFKEVVV